VEFSDRDPAWKLAPALVAGNTVVFKPATLTAADRDSADRDLCRSRNSERRVQFDSRLRDPMPVMRS
jgi:hypothetical protein